MVLDGVFWKDASARHIAAPQEALIRQTLCHYQSLGFSYLRDGGDRWGAGALAAAIGVKAWLEQTGCPGTVTLYGCPGEEGGAAKAFMARDGLWKQLAAALCISAHTVITHRRNIAAKLQIHSAAGLTIYAIVNKLVELSEIKETITDTQS